MSKLFNGENRMSYDAPTPPMANRAAWTPTLPLADTMIKSKDVYRRLLRWLLVLPVFLLLSALIHSPAEAANPQDKKHAEFDHMSTGFPLRGAHERVQCETCHLRGIFKGTPNRCSGCHLRSTEMEASKKSPNHIPTTEECDVCHDYFLPNVSWQLVRMNHDGIVNNCQSCHNGTFAVGQPANHIPTNNLP